MTARERGLKATAQAQEAGIDCLFDSVKEETITVLCGSGVMAYHEGKLLALGEHIPLGSDPIPIFINDVVHHVSATVLV